MTPDQWWWLALGMGVIVVAVVAVLLGLVIAAARSIDGHAKEIWTTGKEIAGNTAAVWTLTQIAGTTPSLRRATESMEQSAERMSKALAGPESTPGRQEQAGS
jgi:heme/copper-type cytochrome/quinol oxidase subunit 2